MCYNLVREPWLVMVFRIFILCYDSFVRCPLKKYLRAVAQSPFYRQPVFFRMEKTRDRFRESIVMYVRVHVFRVNVVTDLSSKAYTMESAENTVYEIT